MLKFLFLLPRNPIASTRVTGPPEEGTDRLTRDVFKKLPLLEA